MPQLCPSVCGGTWTGRICTVSGCSAAAASGGNKSPGKLLRILTRIGNFYFKKDDWCAYSFPAPESKWYRPKPSTSHTSKDQ